MFILIPQFTSLISMSILQEVLFGNFSENDVIELYQNQTSDLRFVWQERVPSAKRCALYGNNLVVQVPTVATSQGGHMPGVLSPNIPPNPPTSPVDATYDLSSRGGLPSKLNVNAVPFVPGGKIGTGAINSLDVAKNSTARQLNSPSSDAQGQSESDRTLSGALEKLKIEDQPNIPGVVVQTVGESSCEMGSESNSRVGSKSNSHSRTDPHLNAAQQSSRIDREQSPAELSLDLSATTQQLESSQRRQPNSTNICSGSPSHSVSSLDERQHDVIQDTTRQATALPTNQAASDHRRSHTHSPTPTPTSPPPHTLSRTPTPSQSNDKLPPQASSDQEKLRSQEAGQQQQQQSLTQPGSQSCSPGSVSSLSSASLSSTVLSTAGSTTSGSGGVKTKSWASIVSKKTSTGQPAVQVSQTSLASSPQVQSASGGGRMSLGDHVTAVATATNNQVQSREDVTQQQVPPLNPAKAHAQLVNLGSEFDKPVSRPTPAFQYSLSLPPFLSPDQLFRWKVNHAPVSIQPRGLINQGNWCYMHAVSYSLTT